MHVSLEILLAEDDETDVLLLRRAFRDAGMTNPLHAVHDGQEAMEFLSRRGDADGVPALVMLDLKMPRRNGLDVLAWLRRQPGLRTIPVIMFSSSAHRDDVERAYALGANAFIVKPASTAQRTEVARFVNDWLRLSQPPIAAVEGFSFAHSLHVHSGKAWAEQPAKGMFE